MKKHSFLFTTKATLSNLIQAYFEHIEGKYHLEKMSSKKVTDQDNMITQKVWDREPEPATIAGLTFFLGFNSRDEFDACERKGKYADILKRARLQIEAAYEKKLDTATGAMFVLKSMGWNEKTESPTITGMVKNIKVKIIESGPQPVSNEKEVVF